MNRLVQEFYNEEMNDNIWEPWDKWDYFFRNYLWAERVQGFTNSDPKWPKQLLSDERRPPGVDNYRWNREECGVLGGDSIHTGQREYTPMLGLGAQRPIPFLGNLPKATSNNCYSIILLWEGWRANKRRDFKQ